MVLLDVGGPYLPRVVYWGADIGDLSDEEIAALPLAAEQVRGPRPGDGGVPITLSPTRAQGWRGWPGLSGHRGGFASQPLFSLEACATEERDGGDAVLYRATDSLAQLVLDGELELTVDGVIRARQTLTSTGSASTGPASTGSASTGSASTGSASTGSASTGPASTGSAAQAPFEVEDFITLLPVPEDTVELLDFCGRWANEAQPQRHEIGQGVWLREQRRGRTGPDTPLVLFAGRPGFGFRHGEVWGVHLGWSGDQRYLLQRLNTGTTVIGAGEIFAPGEVILGPAEHVTTSWAYAVYSGQGIDGASARLHSMLRRRRRHPVKARPVLLNTWEAVGFDQSFERLARLADVAAEVGVERFVIDDGWFGSRRDDTSGLGDWYVARDIWPDGLHPIVDHVRALGMDFGLWFEPEMVNPSSELARAHPEWILGTAGRMPPTWRNQQVLDVAHPDAFAYLLGTISALVTEYGIDFIKWDHNRDLVDPVHRSGPRAGRPAVRDQTLATYRLMDELRARHPDLEIESCSSGGSRVDLGVLERTDRIWASDCIDPIERVRIVSGLSTLVPLELIGAHVASPRSHTTGRQHDLGLRLIVALFGHQGFEWDITTTTAEERKGLAEWVSMAKSLRPLVHHGEVVRVERPSDPGTALFGVVARDKSEGLFMLVRSQASPNSESSPLRFDGLDPGTRYLVKRVVMPGEPGALPGDSRSRPSLDEATLPGSLLMGAGARAPYLALEGAALFHLARVPE
jgi:alpha-galactosidase